MSQPDYPPCSLLYADLREKWKHEDDLINQRITWLLATQGFLLTAFGFLAKLRIDASSETNVGSFSELYELSEVFIVVCALSVTYFLRHGVLAAIRAMDELKRQLRNHQDAGRVWRCMPIDVVDGTSKDGTRPARGMINTLAVTWVMVYLYEVFRLSTPLYEENWTTLIAIAVALGIWFAYLKLRMDSRFTKRCSKSSEQISHHDEA